MILIRLTIFTLVAWFLLPLSISAQANTDVPPNFIEINPSMARGGRPAFAHLQILRDRGLKTIINLESDSQAIEEDSRSAASLGIKFYSFPMTWYGRPKDTDVDQILKLMQDANSFPIFIHCHHGQDRTGLLVGLYRVFVEKWTATKAYDEMRSLGFHKSYYQLDRYFKDRTGLK